MQPILITGAAGTLGRAFAGGCAARNLRHRVTSRAELDIADLDTVVAALARIRPWLVVNAAGFVRVDEAEDEPDRCHRENAVGAELLARACADARVPLVTFSSDLVFDGVKGSPYDEDDAPAPLSVYGSSKASAEARVLAAHPRALVVRTSAFFGPSDEHNLVTLALRALGAGQVFRVPDAQLSPTYVPDLVTATLDLAIDGEHGLWHLTNRGVTTWVDLIGDAARRVGIATERLSAASPHALGLRATRPRFSALGSRRGQLLPELHDAVGRYVFERTQRGAVNHV